VKDIRELGGGGVFAEAVDCVAPFSYAALVEEYERLRPRVTVPLLEEEVVVGG